MSLLAGLLVYLNREFQLALVEGKGTRPAASDRLVLCAALYGSTGAPRLRAEGLVFDVVCGTRCRLLRREECPASGGQRRSAAQVKLLEGPRRGQVVWLCFEDVRWPLRPLP